MSSSLRSGRQFRPLQGRVFQVSLDFFHANPIATMPRTVANSDHRLHCRDTIFQVCIH